MPCGRASCTTSGTGCNVPTSLLAHMTEIRAISSACSAISARRAARSTRPSASTGSRTISAPACSAIQNAGSSTAWCSTADTTMRRRRGSVVRRPQNRPLTARLSASVPPAVKTTSLGRAPSAAATDSRASSTVRRAARPAACSDDGLPVRVSSSTNASRAAGDSGVVAAWSRYAVTGTGVGPPCAPGRAPVTGPGAGVTVTQSTNRGATLAVRGVGGAGHPGGNR